MTPWTVAHHAPLSMEFSRQEYWSELLFPSPGDLPNPGIELGSPTLQVESVSAEVPGKVGDIKLYMKNGHSGLNCVPTK